MGSVDSMRVMAFIEGYFIPGPFPYGNRLYLPFWTITTWESSNARDGGHKASKGYDLR